MRSENHGVRAQLSTDKNAVHRVVLPFKDQKSADAVRRQLSDLSNKIDHTLKPVFKSRKISEDLKMCEPKPPIISQQCVVYNYQCDLCNAEYVAYTSQHLFQRIDKHRYSAIGKHLKNDHGLETIGDLTNNFSVLKKCNGKLDCLIHEMLFMKTKRPCMNTQSDFLRAKLFIKILSSFNMYIFTPLCFITSRGIYYVINFILSSLENDDMESSKRCVKLLSLILVLK